MTQPQEHKDRPVDLASGEAHAFELALLGASLLEGDTAQKSGRVAQTLVRNDAMTLVLTVMKAGAKLHEHKAAAPVTVSVLFGSVTFLVGTGQEEYPLRAGSALVFPPGMPHSARAEEDSAFLIVIGGSHE